MSESNVQVAHFAGKRTPSQSVLDALGGLNDAKIAVLVFLDKDEQINTSWSDGSLLNRVGMLEFAKIRMIELSHEDD